jgi:PAS domain S-box-containing protein
VEQIAMKDDSGAPRWQNTLRERLTKHDPTSTVSGTSGPTLEQVLEPATQPPRLTNDRLLLIIGATIALLAIGLGVLAARWGRGWVVGELPLFVPAISSFTALAAASVSFSTMGRYRVLGDPTAFWVGLAFGVMSILYAVYVLTWPDLGPGEGTVLRTLPNTSVWVFDLAMALTGALLFPASLASWPTPATRSVARLLAIVCLGIAALVGILVVVFELSLPPLVIGSHFTPASHALTGALVALYGGGAALSTRRYRRSGDALLGHVALFQAAAAFAVFAFILSDKRYDPWWYSSRLIVAGVVVTVLFGTLGGYVGLYRLERERARTLDRQRALLYAVIEQMPAGVVIAEAPSGRVLVVNARMAQLFRRPDLPANALEDHPSRQGFHPDGRPYPADEWPLSRTIRYGEVVRGEEITILRGDGTYGVVSVNGAPVRDRDGRIIAGVIIDLDITERQAAEEALRERERQLRELNDELEDRVVERTQQLRALAADLTMAEERKRRRLAQVLHDDLQQVLAAATFHLERLRLQADATNDGHDLDEPLSLLRQAILTSRTLTSELSPTILYEMGLLPALHWLGRQMEEQYGIQVTVHGEERTPALPIPEDIEVFLFQAARELLFNVVKHAETDGATLDLTYPTPESIAMTVTDTGRGFVPTPLTGHGQAPMGYGLFGVSERLQLIGGRMRIDSAPGRGTKVSLVVPLPHTDAQA